MRPREEIRLAMVKAASELSRERGGATWREMGARACVGFYAARQAAHNMHRAGELEKLGTVRVPHANRPMVLYGYVDAAAGARAAARGPDFSGLAAVWSPRSDATNAGDLMGE
jgi:hypothetical protein